LTRREGVGYNLGEFGECIWQVPHGITGERRRIADYMAVEVGSICEGTVVKLLPYGALVRLPDGETGLVHISEIDDSFVRDVSDYFHLDDTVSVKVLGVNEKGKIELSVRQAGGRAAITRAAAQRPQDAQEAERAEERRQDGDLSFDEKMSKFMKQSSERLLDLRRNIENKRGGKKR